MINREAIAERQEGYCLWCEAPLGHDYAIHHRKLRKHGGPDTPDNLVALHHHCHNLGTHSVHLNPLLSYERGFLVKSWADHNQTPLTTPSGATVSLREDGTQQKERNDEW